MCTARYERSESVVSVSSASKASSTSATDVVSRSFPSGPKSRTVLRQLRRGGVRPAVPSSLIFELKRITTRRTPS